jgi:hypothetical protein
MNIRLLGHNVTFITPHSVVSDEKFWRGIISYIEVMGNDFLIIFFIPRPIY